MRFLLSGLAALGLLLFANACWLCQHPLNQDSCQADDDDPLALLLAAVLSPSGPEISVFQGATEIPSNGAFMFPNAPALLFTITNAGGGTLMLGVATHTDPADFNLSQPLSATIAPGGMTTFTMDNFNGGMTATTLTIPNNDSNESSYV
ncbi:MAG: hypothetical protein K1X75_18135, partial [Leptospirales bacterium]|nr:hypothetical protein [Leptospirales bacterium]